jgi:hypothetical protein
MRKKTSGMRFVLEVCAEADVVLLAKISREVTSGIAKQLDGNPHDLLDCMWSILSHDSLHRESMRPRCAGTPKGPDLCDRRDHASGPRHARRVDMAAAAKKSAVDAKRLRWLLRELARQDAKLFAKTAAEVIAETIAKSL